MNDFENEEFESAASSADQEVLDQVSSNESAVTEEPEVIVEIYDTDKCTVVVGDECYSHKCISEQIPTGCSVCYEKSVEFIKKYSNGKYKLLFCHDEAIIGE